MDKAPVNCIYYFLPSFCPRLTHLQPRAAACQSSRPTATNHYTTCIKPMPTNLTKKQKKAPRAAEKRNAKKPAADAATSTTAGGLNNSAVRSVIGLPVVISAASLSEDVHPLLGDVATSNTNAVTVVAIFTTAATSGLIINNGQSAVGYARWKFWCVYCQ